MDKIGNEPEYRQEVAFINRQKELTYLKHFIDKKPSEILFIHGPKSSGKTTLLYKFLEDIGKEQKLDVKYLNLRKVLISNYKDFIRIFFNIEDSEKRKKISSTISAGFFKIDSEIENKILNAKADPFKIMENEFITLNKKGKKPVLVIDELQSMDNIYMNNSKERQLIIELFNFFVAMSKESHLAHIIIASSDGYFIKTVYNDSRLKKTSEFYKVDYLEKEDVMEWLLNLEKYSKITEYTLTENEAEKIWDVLGGSMWEIQNLLTQLFENSVDDSLFLYKKTIRGLIAHYAGFDNDKKEIFKLMSKKKVLTYGDLEGIAVDRTKVESLLQDMVRNNIIHFDPTEAAYYPQGPGYQWGIDLYCEGLK